MVQTIRSFLSFEAMTFLLAALVHAGFLIEGYEHVEARNAELVIGMVLLAGLTLTWIRPTLTRAAGLATQGFALFGTLVGILTIIIGVGPRTALDLVYHAGIVIVLIAGLVAAARARLRDVHQPA